MRPPMTQSPAPLPLPLPLLSHARTHAHTQLLKASGKEDERYPHAFDLRVTVTLEDESLTQELAATNTGEYVL